MTDTREMRCYSCTEEQMFDRVQGLSTFECQECGSERRIYFG